MCRRADCCAAGQACKRLVAQHRLVLSGTPIQNNVLELWALFDILMPGFLGDEAAFNATFGKALAEARGSRAGSAQAQAGLLAMDRLHKQVRALGLLPRYHLKRCSATFSSKNVENPVALWAQETNICTLSGRIWKTCL